MAGSPGDGWGWRVGSVVCLARSSLSLHLSFSFSESRRLSLAVSIIAFVLAIIAFQIPPKVALGYFLARLAVSLAIGLYDETTRKRREIRSRKRGGFSFGFAARTR